MKARISVLLFTVYLVIYGALYQYHVTLTLSEIIFLVSPVLLLACVATVLNEKSYPEPEPADEEWVSGQK